MKKVLVIVANVAAWLIVIFAFLITIIVFSSTSNNGVPQLFGYIPLTVESPSMRPTFDQGDLIISKKIDDPSTLQVGDVISFWTIIDGQKVKNTHRIVRIEGTGTTKSFITRGDNNPIDDELPAYSGELIGKWTGAHLTGAGNIMAFLRTRLGFFICILIPMALFFLFELYKFIVTVVRIRKPQTVPALDEEEIKRRAIEEYLAEQKKKEEETKSSEQSADEPKEEPKKDTEKADELKEEPKKDTEKTDEPKEEPKKDTEKADEQKEEPKKDTEKTDEPKEEPKKDAEKTDEPKEDTASGEQTADK